MVLCFLLLHEIPNSNTEITTSRRSKPTIQPANSIAAHTEPGMRHLSNGQNLFHTIQPYRIYNLTCAAWWSHGVSVTLLLCSPYAGRLLLLPPLFHLLNCKSMEKLGKQPLSLAYCQLGPVCTVSL